MVFEFTNYVFMPPSLMQDQKIEGVLDFESATWGTMKTDKLPLRYNDTRTGEQRETLQ